jgi:hypothetical protein
MACERASAVRPRLIYWVCKSCVSGVARSGICTGGGGAARPSKGGNNLLALRYGNFCARTSGLISVIEWTRTHSSMQKPFTHWKRGRDDDYRGFGPYWFCAPCSQWILNVCFLGQAIQSISGFWVQSSVRGKILFCRANCSNFNRFWRGVDTLI